MQISDRLLLLNDVNEAKLFESYCVMVVAIFLDRNRFLQRLSRAVAGDERRGVLFKKPSVSRIW